MANEIRAKYPSGSTLYSRIRNSAGLVASTVASAFVSWADGDVANYDITMVDKGGGLYIGNIPAWVVAIDGDYEVGAFLQSGGLPLISDKEVNSGQVSYASGFEILSKQIKANGLDLISITAPTGVASNFREMAVQTWRRFFKKVDISSADGIRCYADDGTTVSTSQAIAEVDGVQTQGGAV